MSDQKQNTEGRKESSFTLQNWLYGTEEGGHSRAPIAEDLEAIPRTTRRANTAEFDRNFAVENVFSGQDVGSIPDHLSFGDGSMSGEVSESAASQSQAGSQEWGQEEVQDVEVPSLVYAEGTSLRAKYRVLLECNNDSEVAKERGLAAEFEKESRAKTDNGHVPIGEPEGLVMVTQDYDQAVSLVGGDSEEMEMWTASVGELVEQGKSVLARGDGSDGLLSRAHGAVEGFMALSYRSGEDARSLCRAESDARDATKIDLSPWSRYH